MIQDLGNKTGTILFFGGPYSNLHALQALQTKARELGIVPSNIICTGDIAGYCAYPEEAIQLVKDWGIHSIAGNVEFSLLDKTDDCGCNFEEGSRCDLFSRQWFPFAKDRVSEDSLTYLATLPTFIRFTYAGQKHFVLHGSHQNTSAFIFKSTPWDIKTNNFLTTGADVIIAGHCGLPFYDRREEKTWVNAGVIGMPANDGNQQTWYTLLSEDGFSFHRLTYDARTAQEAMLLHSLPNSYAQTLLDGLWDNCDILPEEETQAQGSTIIIEVPYQKI